MDRKSTSAAPSATTTTATGSSARRSKKSTTTTSSKTATSSAKPSSASSAKSNEVKALVEKLKQLVNENQGVKTQDTHAEQLRHVSTKLFNAVKAQSGLRHVFNSDPANNLAFVPGILKNCIDVIVVQNIVKLLLDCLSAKAGSVRHNTFRVLLEWDIVGMSYDCLDNLRVSLHLSDSAVSCLHQLIVEAGARDPQFSSKAKKNGIKLSCLVVKNVNFEAKNFVPVVKVFKMYSRVGSTCRAALSREQAVTLLVQVLNSDGKRPPVHTTLILEALAGMCKQKNLCQEAVKCGLPASALKILRSWQFVDTTEQIKLCRAALSALNRVASFGFGVTPIKKAGGLEIVEKLLSACPPNPPSFDPLLSKAAELYHYVAVKKPLPVPSPRGPFKFVDKKTVLSYVDDADSKSSDTIKVEESSSGSDLDQGSEDGSEMGREATPATAGVGANNNNNRPSSTFLLVAANTFQKSSPELMAFSDYFAEISAREARLIEPPDLPSPWGIDLLNTRKQIMMKFREKAGYTVDMGELDVAKPPSALKLSPNVGHIHFVNRESRMQIRGKVAGFPDGASPIIEKPPIGDKLTLARYSEEASKVRSVVPFVKAAYPDFCSDVTISIMKPMEKLYEKDRMVCREKLVSVVKKISSESFKPFVVYDLDVLGKADFPELDPEDLTPIRERELCNNDLEMVTMLQQSVGGKTVGALAFESRFESGNLRRVVQVGPREYDLFVNPDVGTMDHHLWFYFQVSNMTPGVAYTFNIASCEKSNCQFNFGMQPVMFSVAESMAVAADPTKDAYTWERVGTNICYYSNQYGGVTGRKSQPGSAGFRSASFTVQFKHANDICYFAYHYPYTYSALKCHLDMWKEKAAKNATIYMTRQAICKSEAGNPVPLLTVTDIERKEKKPFIVLSARVHPGESNSSWVMKGTIDFLLGDHPVAKALRKAYIFKILPMLNVDGVVNGNGRCSLYGEDLNRRWKSPDPNLHPSIYAAKGLIAYLTHQLGSPPFLYCDYHGHARFKNIFTYGCSPTLSWNKSDAQSFAYDPLEFQGFPLALHHLCPSFALDKCDFTIARDRETTARVTVWREFNIPRSYTLESTYCGCADGPYRGFHIGIRELKESGAKLCEAIYCLDDKGKPRLHLRPGVDRRAVASQVKGPSSEWKDLPSPIDVTSSSSCSSESSSTSSDPESDV